MADYLPKFKPGQAVTFKASAAVTGGRLVAVTGDRAVGPAGADALAIGTAGFDATAGEDVTVFLRGNGVHPLVAAGAIAAGAQVISATGGEVATIGDGSNPIGIALTAAATDQDVIDVLYL
ncbi:capsid cement protein [Cellulosimicrobium funkei]|uniref:capsid cement protein n=1 Tax=Cellulosimicrobium funkei TaxID=264251 RepID=UPI00367A10A5